MNKAVLGLLLAAAVASRPAFGREFNSSLRLKVFVRGSGEIPDHVIGFTPAKRGRAIHVPESDLWYVRPSGSLGAAKLDELARLMKNKNIPGLDLSDHWELTNASLRHLRRVSGLRMLDISRTRISDAGISKLNPFHQLSVLILPETMTNHALEEVSHFQGLRELSLDQARVSDPGIAALTRLSNLQILDLSSTSVTDEGVAFLSKFPDLKRLVLGSLATEACAPHLRNLKKLEEIDITQTQIGPKGLSSLAKLKKLKTIFLNRQVTDAGLASLSASRSLRALDLTRAAITNEGVRYLAKIKSLEELALSQTGVDNGCINSLARLPGLRMLELSDTHVTSEGLAPLASVKTLEVLSLSWQTLTHQDIQNMAKLKQLKTIVLNGVPLPESTMAQLRHVGSPSPWDHVAGIEKARLRETKQTDLRALSAPVALPEPRIAANVKPEPAKPAEALSRPSVASLTPARTLSPSPNAVIEKSKAPPISHEKIETVMAKQAPAVAAPLESPQKIALGEDRLLETIAHQSNPEHSGAFSGLSAMRQIRQTETLASLNSVTSATPRAEIPVEDDENPKNSLGEISVGVRPSH